MIQLSSVVDNDANNVTLVANTDMNTVSFYIRLGNEFEQALSLSIPVSNGVAVFVDTAPPQKTRVTYFAVADDFERSNLVNVVVPTTYSLTKPCLQGDIRLGDLVLNTIDSDGTIWTVTDIDGYWRLPDAQVPVQDRAILEDGAYDDAGRFVARSMVFTGLFLPRSMDTFQEARKKVTRAFNAVRSTTYLEVDEMPARRLTVRANGRSEIQTIRANGLTQFSVQLLAADPIKYSVDPMVQPSPNDDQAFLVTSGFPAGGRTYPRAYTVDIAGTPTDPTDDVRQYGSIGAPNTCQIYNAGDYFTPPVFTFQGPVNNPRLTLLETGEYLEFTISLSQGEYLVVDVKEKTVLLNAAISMRGTMTFSSTWFRFPQGTSTIKYTSGSGDGAIVTCEAYSAWL